MLPWNQEMGHHYGLGNPVGLSIVPLDVLNEMGTPVDVPWSSLASMGHRTVFKGIGLLMANLALLCYTDTIILLHESLCITGK